MKSIGTKRSMAAAVFGSLVAATALTMTTATAQIVDGPIRLLVGTPAGGSNDLVARSVAEKMREMTGQVVIVENKTGASQRLAVGEVKRAAPDGKTLVLATSGTFTIHPHIFPKLEYDPVNDFTPIAGVVRFDSGIAVNADLPIHNMQDFEKWVKEHPEQASYGTPGAGTVSHFTGILLGNALGVDLTHVPYRGGAPAMADLVGGQIPIVLNSLADLVEMHKAGRIRVLGSSGNQRLSLLPDVPTLLEQGVNVDASVTLGIYGPAGMDPELVQKLNRAILEAAAQPDVQKRFVDYGLIPQPLSPSELAALLDRERKSWEEPVKGSGYIAE